MEILKKNHKYTVTNSDRNGNYKKGETVIFEEYITGFPLCKTQSKKKVFINKDYLKPYKPKTNKLGKALLRVFFALLIAYLVFTQL